ncbi:T9SS type A sorting domain-containing protein, partial [Crocinitomicaceae bacterium]|nr:T9SS type A sorting domain-containing protein [Crocinitomicaceae bacterium]
LGAESLSSNYYSIAPNPANGSIKINGAFNGQLQIVNSEGRVVLNEFYSANETLDISKLTSGFYMLRLNNEEGSFDKKLIIQ